MYVQSFKESLIQALTSGTGINTPHRTTGCAGDSRGYGIELWIARETAIYMRSRAGGTPVTPAVTGICGIGNRIEIRLSFTCPGLAENLTVCFTHSGRDTTLVIYRGMPAQEVWRARGRESSDSWMIRTLETA